MNEIQLSTGKKVGLRAKKGQHHFIERNLMAVCMGTGGQNLGGALSSMTIRAVVSVASVDGEPVSIPNDLSGVYELMDRFDYDEWIELERETMPKAEKEQLEKLSANLQKSPGSETE